jgi:glycosyltransferase involved in cell wall biosynthesis
MTPPPSVSIIIPSKNAAHFLECSLSALKLSDYPADKLEIIVVDNGSTDTSPAIASQYGAKVLTDIKATIAGLRNIGAEAANGEVLIFLDADCLLAPDWIGIAVSHLADPQIGMAGSIINLLPENCSWVAKIWALHLSRNLDSKTPRWLGSRAIAVKREAFIAANSFNAKLVTCEDVAFGHELSKKYRIANDPRLAPVHLGEPVSLWAFFRKEIWHGKNSIATSLRYLSHPKELIGIALPIYFAASLAAILAGAVIWLTGYGTWALLWGLAAFFIPVLALSVDTCNKTGSWGSLPQLVIVYSTYLIARVLALFQ